jgi:hypothetical protein
MHVTRSTIALATSPGDGEELDSPKVPFQGGWRLAAGRSATTRGRTTESLMRRVPLVRDDICPSSQVGIEKGLDGRVEGRKAVADLYRPYGTMVVLDRCHDRAAHHDIKTGVVVLEVRLRRPSRFDRDPVTPRGTSRSSRSPIARSRTGATASAP